MNARQEASRLRRQCGASGQVRVEEVAHLVGLEIDGRQFRVREVDEIAYGSGVAVAYHLDAPDQRWAVAHAIGHRVLHGTSWNQVWLRTCTQLPDKLEAQAEQFAYHLLIDLDEAWDEGLETAEEVAEYFGVPVGMIGVQGRLV